jgi:hypothetical protein
MSKAKLPVRVDSGVHPKSTQADEQLSDLVEIAKRSSEFSTYYGKVWGGFIQLSLANAATGRRPFLWGGFTLVGGFILKYALPKLFG